MYAIYCDSVGMYFMKDSEKVIVFDTPEEAAEFAQAFYQYANLQAMQMIFSQPQIVFDVMNATSTTEIRPFDLEADSDIKWIAFKDLKK